MSPLLEKSEKRQSFDCVKKMKKVYETWRNFDKSKKRQTENIKIQYFVSDMDNLFDLAHADAQTIIKTEEDKEFLKSQRKPGRPGCMLGVDAKITNKEKRKQNKLETEAAKRKKLNSELTSGKRYRYFCQAFM